YVATRGFLTGLMPDLGVGRPLALLAILMARRVVGLTIGQVMRYEGLAGRVPPLWQIPLIGSGVGTPLARLIRARAEHKAVAATACMPPPAQLPPDDLRDPRRPPAACADSSALNAVTISRWAKLKPAASSLAGKTLALPSSSPATSPRAILSTMAGRLSKAGLRSTAASALVNWEFVTGAGAERLNGPVASAEPSRNLMALPSSVRLIQLRDWRPDPNVAPRPSRNGSSSRPSMPPRAASTMPERKLATRMPADLAGSAAASQSRTSSARNPAPPGAL